MSRDKLMLGTDQGMRDFVMECVTTSSCSITMRLDAGSSFLTFPAQSPAEYAADARAALRPIVQTAYEEGVRDGLIKALDMMSARIDRLEGEVQELCDLKNEMEDSLKEAKDKLGVKLEELHSARVEMERVRVAMGVPK